MGFTLPSDKTFFKKGQGQEHRIATPEGAINKGEPCKCPSLQLSSFSGKKRENCQSRKAKVTRVPTAQPGVRKAALRERTFQRATRIHQESSAEC